MRKLSLSGIQKRLEENAKELDVYPARGFKTTTKSQKDGTASAVQAPKPLEMGTPIKAKGPTTGLPVKHTPVETIPTLYSSMPTATEWTSAETKAFSQLQGSFLQGMDPNKVDKVKIKVVRPKVDPKGLLTLGGIVSESSGIINGRVEVKVGQKEYVFEAVHTSQVRKIAKSYATVGQPISITVRLGWRGAYSDPTFKKNLTEASHARSLGHPAWRKEMLEKSLTRFVALVEAQRVKSFYPNRDQWVVEVVKPAFTQAVKTFDTLYERSLKPFEVQVQAKTRQGREVFDIVTRALNERCAAALGFKAVRESTGPSTQMIHAFVGTEKFLYEEAMGVFGYYKPDFSHIETSITKGTPMTTKSTKVADPTGTPAMPKVGKADVKPKNVKSKGTASVKNDLEKDHSGMKYAAMPKTKTTY